MNNQESILIQKKTLQVLLKWLEIVEECDAKIAELKDVSYFKACRAEAIENYATTMISLIETVIITTKTTL